MTRRSPARKQGKIVASEAMQPPTTTQPRTAQNNLLLGLPFALLVLTGLCLFFIPAVVIRPFSYQSPRALAVAMAVRQQAPLWTVLVAALSLLLAVRLWRRISHWKEALLVLGMLFVSASAVMSRVDYFEWMFHPVPAPGFTSAEKAKLDPAQMVMAVRFGTETRAYPIGAMAYHHVVNDVVAGVPIAVTY
jgi:hypothetical protein